MPSIRLRAPPAFLAACMLLSGGPAMARGHVEHHAAHRAPVHHRAPVSGYGHESHGYYRSSDGSTVHGPTAERDDSIYGKPSAHCEDGTWSHSHHHRGTCSGHGGVEAWL